MYQYEVIYVSKLPLIRHEVLVLPSGRATHNHPDKQVVVESVGEAIGSRRVVGRKVVKSHLNESQIIARAQALASSRRYNLGYNCEDYIAELFGKRPTSKQRNFWFTFGLIGLGLLAAR